MELGLLLLRIERARVRHGLPASPLQERQQHASWAAQVLPRHSEGLCWLRTMQHELLQGSDDVLACASDEEAVLAVAARREMAAEVVRAEGINEQLSAWHDMIEGGAATSTSALGDDAARLLLGVFVARSALEAIGVLLESLVGAPWLVTTPKDARIRHVAERLHNARANILDRSISSLRLEGCDLSITAAQRSAAPTGQLSRAHWWWWIEAPCFVSGGCPLIR